MEFSQEKTSKVHLYVTSAFVLYHDMKSFQAEPFTIHHGAPDHGLEFRSGRVAKQTQLIEASVCDGITGRVLAEAGQPNTQAGSAGSRDAVAAGDEGQDLTLIRGGRAREEVPEPSDHRLRTRLL